MCGRVGSVRRKWSLKRRDRKKLSRADYYEARLRNWMTISSCGFRCPWDGFLMARLFASSEAGSVI